MTFNLYCVFADFEGKYEFRTFELWLYVILYYELKCIFFGHKILLRQLIYNYC